MWPRRKKSPPRRASGGDAIAVQADVSKPRSSTPAAHRGLVPTGCINVWINNIGIGALGRFWDIPVEDHARVVDVNQNTTLSNEWCQRQR